MKCKSIVTGAICAFLVLAPPLAWACGGPESTAHVGSVIEIDGSLSTFTILDAESGSPISFRASDEILQALERLGDMIRVQFEDRGGVLHAIAVKYLM